MFSVMQGLFQTLLADRSTALHFPYDLAIIFLLQCIDVSPFEILWFPLTQEEIQTLHFLYCVSGTRHMEDKLQHVSVRIQLTNSNH